MSSVSSVVDGLLLESAAMKRCIVLVFLIVLGGFVFAEEPVKFEPLPVPLTNNAVASIKSRGALYLYSFMGMGAKKTWDATSNAAYMLDPETGKWAAAHPVPGTVGRLAASAIGAREHVFLFGGYVVDAQGGETTLSDVNVYEPLTDRWFRAEDMLTPVDDAVVGVYRDRYIYVIGGWSKTDAVHDVQLYDAQKNKWSRATPIPGTPVFGHAGAVVGDTIVYIDGAHKNPAGGKPKYIASDECWVGKIDHHDLTKIQWTKLPNHPGTARYRIAAGASEKDQKIYFSGGTDNPYNYNGIGYNGAPAEPSPVTFAFDVRSGKWETINEHTSQPTMDHRGLLVIPEGLVIFGGMEKAQQVTARVSILSKTAKGK
jgi:N-acetylneuraminic acid mutarotase